MTETEADRRRFLIPLALVFGVYLVLLVWCILWKFAVPWIAESAGLPHPVKLIPFVPDGTADASSPFEVLANVLFFVPLGGYVAALARGWRWFAVAGLAFGVSLTLEIMQHVIATGSFDTSDLIANTAGGLAGYAVVALARRRPDSRRAVGIVVIAGTAIWLLALGLFIASGIRYAPQHDVIVTSAAMP